MTLLSIITVNFNNAAGLQKTIESVVSQQCDWIEFILIDGGSTDGSFDLLKDYEDIFAYSVSEPDRGIYHAMNKGITKSSGAYVLFLNSGDHFYNSNCLKEYMSHLHSHDIIAFDIEMVHKNQSKIKQHPDVLQFSYLFKETFAHQSTLVKRTLFKTVGLYDENLEIVADWKFFIDALTKHEATYNVVHKVLTTYYLDGISATGKGTNIRKAERRKILQNEYAFFYDDYLKMNILNENRFLLLKELESSKVAQKLNSLWLRFLLLIIKGKNVKDL